MDRGTYVSYDGRPAVRFERTYRYPIERVWRAVTDPAELVQWFPSRVTLDPRPGGTVRFSGDPNVEATTGTVLAFEPPRRLAFTWGADELHLELVAIDDTSCRLSLVNVLEAREAAARNAAGWSVCLDELTRLLSVGAARGPHGDSAATWRPYYEAYLADGLPSGAPVPAEA